VGRPPGGSCQWAGPVPEEVGVESTGEGLT